MTTFTMDWFSNCIVNFEYINAHFKKPSSILEIGCFEGRATCWMLENMLTNDGVITCIDPFGIRVMSAFEPYEIDPDPENLNIFTSNIAEVKLPGQTVNTMINLSVPALAQLIVDKQQYDFIYVDGSHAADAVLTDACMAFALLKPGGVMLFDDYLWDHHTDHFDRPKMSVDSFANLFINRIEVVFINYQLCLKKKEMP
jgi:predicted O-methyltransferase YrrM